MKTKEFEMARKGKARSGKVGQLRHTVSFNCPHCEKRISVKATEDKLLWACARVLNRHLKWFHRGAEKYTADDFNDMLNPK